VRSLLSPLLATHDSVRMSSKPYPHQAAPARAAKTRSFKAYPRLIRTSVQLTRAVVSLQGSFLGSSEEPSNIQATANALDSPLLQDALDLARVAGCRQVYCDLLL
jgi:hypothetical protein